MTLTRGERRDFRLHQIESATRDIKEKHGEDAEFECHVCGDGGFVFMTVSEQTLKELGELNTKIDTVNQHFDTVVRDLDIKYDGKTNDIYEHIESRSEKLAQMIASKIRFLCWTIGILTTIAVGCFTGITGLCFIGVNYAIDKSIQAENEMDQAIKWLITQHEGRVHKGAATTDETDKLEILFLEHIKNHKEAGL